MANADAPYGFIPYRHLSGGTPGRANEYTIASGYASDIFHGDAVKSVGTSKRIQLAAAGNAIRGIFVGCSYVNAQGEQKWSPYWPASTVATEIKAVVIDDPNMTFRAQALAEITEADEGLLANLNAATAGNTTTGISAMKVGAHDGSEDQMKILRILTEHPVVKSDGKLGFSEAGNYATVEVLFVKHELRGSGVEV